MMANLELVSKMAEFGPDSGGRVKVNRSNSDLSLCVKVLRVFSNCTLRYMVHGVSLC